MDFFGSSGVQWRFKEGKTLAQRCSVARRLRKDYPDRVPVIVQAAPGAALTLTREKFLAPGEVTMGRFLREVRRAVGDDPDSGRAMFLLVGNTQVLAPAGATVAQVHERHKDAEDGMVYMQVALENTFG